AERAVSDRLAVGAGAAVRGGGAGGVLADAQPGAPGGASTGESGGVRGRTAPAGAGISATRIADAMMSSFLPLMRAAASEEGGGFDIPSMILHHLADSHEWETPFGVIHLPQFAPVHVGPLTIDFSITKHVLFMMIAAVFVAILLILAARDAKREHTAGAGRGPKGAANVVEALILFIRDEIALKNIGHGGERYVPYIVSVFFFILFCNLLGLIPWG